MTILPTSINSILSEEINDKIKIISSVENSRLEIFKISHEDHTIGNLLFQKLLQIKEITYCGYTKPHPLDNYIILKILTNRKVTTKKILDSCLKDIYVELSLIV